MEKNRTYRIRTGVNDGTPVINFAVDSSVDTYEILSLKIDQKNAYRLMASNSGVVAGRVLANNGFGVPNAKISVFVQYEDDENLYRRLLYHFSSSKSQDDNRIRYNLLPDGSDDECHQTVGTFPRKRFMLDDDNWVDVFDKYYRYTTRTNASGDYMIYGVPVGVQTLHMDVDLSDIGPLSQRPRDMIGEGYNADMFESPNKFKSGTNLSSLVQIKSEDVSLYVYPFWGDTTDTPTNAAITRHDFSINYTFKPTCVFMGCVMSDTGENSLSKKCVAAKKQGKMSELMTGEGKIEMIRKTFDGNIEEFSIKGNNLINGDGVWCYQIPMNLDYIVTDEYGNTVLSDNPEKGIPTRARVRFRVSMSESPNDETARKRSRYLIPNNPHLIQEDYPDYYKTKQPDYEFGSKTKDESFRDLMWNNVYTVKSYIPRIQKSRLPNNLRHTGIKAVNHPGSHNPMPFNNLRIKMNFTYMFMCALVKVFVYLILGLNKVITAISFGIFKIAQSFIGITYWLGGKALGSFYGLNGSCNKQKYYIAKKYGKCNKNPYYYNLVVGGTEDEDTDGNKEGNYDTRSDVASATLFMLAIIHQISEQNCNNNSNFNKFKYIIREIGSTPCTRYNGKQIGVKGFAAFLLAIVYVIGCGIELKGLCETEDGEEISVTPGTVNGIIDIFTDTRSKYSDMFDVKCSQDVASLFNCIENELAQENEVTRFNFCNDWINGALYFPLWYRKIRPKRKFLGTFEIKAKDQWCSTDANWINAEADKRQLKVYSTCALEQDIITNTNEPMHEKLVPLEDSYSTINVQKSKADDETGIEKIVFNTYEEKNCYGMECHKRVRSYVPMLRGLNKEKETIVGDLVYYYKPCDYSTKYVSDVITLFATDLVLLGSLSDCDIHGVPQFFKALESTTYNMPPDLMSEVYEYKQNANDIYTDDKNSEFIENATRVTEYTGADWGDLGTDQSHYSNPQNPKLETNENIYDNGGLFYGITCFNSFTKPKSCINLARICEFGVSLDESQDILSTTSLEQNTQNPPDENMYTTLTPDGFVSYDEIYNPDYRSMFATLNANFLRTKLNYTTGLTEYDFNHLYVDNFDGVMSTIMNSTSVHGQMLSPYNGQPNYTGNYRLEKSSDSYLNFRYGDYEKANGCKLYYYDYDTFIAKVGPVGKKEKINAKKRFPRYENSFYFYFGLNEGKTAIDSFYSQYYSDCTNDEKLQPSYEINFQANSPCASSDELDGYITFNMNTEPDFIIRIVNSEGGEYYTDPISSELFYFGTLPEDTTLSGYVKAKLYYALDASEVAFIQNGQYTLHITTGDGEILTETINMVPERIPCDINGFDFTCKNTELDATFASLNPDGSYNWAVMFTSIANYKLTGAFDETTSRPIYGFIKVGGIGLVDFKIKIEALSQSFFTDENGTWLYTAPEITVSNNSIVHQYGDGYLGNNGTDYYFGVPYGNQQYKVTIIQMCDGVESQNTVSEIVYIHEGDFKMYLNGIDYDIIQSFRSGWVITDQTRLDDTLLFDYTQIYGWNDIENIGRYYDTATHQVVPLTNAVSYGTTVNEIISIANVLSDDYDGNGAVYMVNGQDCSNPYLWSGEYCLPYNTVESYDTVLDSHNNTITDANTGEIIPAIRSDVSHDTSDNTYTVHYTILTFSSVTPITVATEIYNPDTNEITTTYEDGYEELGGTTLNDIITAIDTINSIISMRAEFVRRVKGAFRIGADGTSLEITYRSPSTPIKYLIAGTKERTSAFHFIPVGEDPLNPPSSGDIPNFKFVYDTSFESSVIDFKLPTIKYSNSENPPHYIPYTFQYTMHFQTTFDIQKLPYFVSIKNNVNMTIPNTSTNSNNADNFDDDEPENPYLNNTFGVHFYDNAIYYDQVRLVSRFNYIPLYGSNNDEYVNCDALVIGYAMNGMSPDIEIDGSQNLIHIAHQNDSDVLRYVENRRLIYDDSTSYGEYTTGDTWIDENGATVPDYQYFTLSRNRIITIYDGYGPQYEHIISCDYDFNIGYIEMFNSQSAYITIPIETTRSIDGYGTKYHIFKYRSYSGSTPTNLHNHPLDYAEYDTSSNTWSIVNVVSVNGEMVSNMIEMLKPSYNFTAHPGYIDTVEGDQYNYQYNVEEGSNPIFIVAENEDSGIISFSPILECGPVNCVKNFNLQGSSGTGIDKYTIYLLRMFIDGHRDGGNINDFYYLTKRTFTLNFKAYNTINNTSETVLSCEIDPTDQNGVVSFVDITINEQDTTSTGHAMKLSLSQYANDFGPNGIPSWYSVWITDITGLERFCISVGGEDTRVIEN